MEGERRCTEYRIRLTMDEKKKLEMIAKNENTSMAEFLRTKINEEFNQMLGYGIKGKSWQ